MTGWYGPRIGYLSNRARPIPDTIAAVGTIGQALRSLGYRTAVAGKWQHDPSPAECGFAEHFIWQRWPGYDGPIEDRTAPRPGRAARYWHPALVENGVGVPTGPDDFGPDLIARWSVDFIKRNADTPAFVLHNEVLVHVAWHFERRAVGYVATPGEARARFGSLTSNVAYFDELVGRMVRELQEAGISPLVIVTSDNGTLGWGKYVLRRQRGPRVPLLVTGESVAAGARDQLVDSSDFYPTLCHLAGGGERRDGFSFSPALTEPAYVGREWAYSWLDEHDFVRTRRWLLDGKNQLFAWRASGRLVVQDTATARRARRELERIAVSIRTGGLPAG